MVSALRILLVEDDPALGRSVARVLGQLGHRVCLVVGCEAARAVRETFDCAVLDLDLRDGHGVDLGSELILSKSAEFVVFFTASCDARALERASLLGPVVNKAGSTEQLSRALNERVAEARRLAYVSRRRASGVLSSPVASGSTNAATQRLAAGGKDES